ncbi:MAG: hypothetical protein RR432_05670 [Alistipes sp.]
MRHLLSISGVKSFIFNPLSPGTDTRRTNRDRLGVLPGKEEEQDKERRKAKIIGQKNAEPYIKTGSLCSKDILFFLFLCKLNGELCVEHPSNCKFACVASLSAGN